MSKLRSWARVLRQIIQHQPDRWLGAYESRDIEKVCQAMFCLNRYAKTRLRYFPVYTMKNRLTRRLYREFVPTRVIREWQVLTCHNCEGTGEHWNGDSCWRCGGTGVYRRIELFRFTFDVGVGVFSWHQPASTVNFPVFVEDSDHIIHGLIEGKYDEFDTHEIVRAFETVNAYLGDERIPITSYAIWPHILQGLRISREETKDFLIRAKYLPQPTWDDLPF